MDEKIELEEEGLDRKDFIINRLGMAKAQLEIDNLMLQYELEKAMQRLQELETPIENVIEETEVDQ